MTPKSSFVAAADAMQSDSHKMQLGENGCLEYTDAGLGSDILALSQKVRGATDVASITKTVLARGNTNEIVQLVTLLFVTRNTRGGKGEKKLAYDMFLEVWDAFPETSKQLLGLFPHYGYWKDLFLLMDMARTHSIRREECGFMNAAMDLIKAQWMKDVAALQLYKKSLADAMEAGDVSGAVEIRKKGPSISLLAKWMPREGKGLDKHTKFVNQFSKAVYGQDVLLTANTGEKWMSSAKKKYRLQVAELTSFLALPEVLLAAQRADEIQIARVASKATKRLTNAFLNEGTNVSEDPKRMRLRDMFLDHIVEKGLKGGQVMPHEIVSTILNNRGKITKGMELALDAQWKAIWRNVVEQVKAKAAEEGLEFNPTQMVPVSDVSGSMYGVPMEVAIALGIGISEITHEAFHDRVLTFHTNPSWHQLNPTDSIVGKVNSLARAPWGGSTDFEKTYDLILQVALENKLSREDFPSLIVFSDMQFNEAAFGWGSPKRSTETMFDNIKRKFGSVANELGWTDAEPTPMVFWNLRNTRGHPVDKDQENTVLLSGFSPSLLKLVMNGEALKEQEVEVVQEDGQVVAEKVRVTPEEILRKMLEDPIYDPVRKVLGESKEGALLEFELLVADGSSDEEPSLHEEEFELV